MLRLVRMHEKHAVQCGILVPNQHLLEVNKKLYHYRPGQALRRSRRLKLPEFSDNRHMKVAMLSGLCSSRLYPQQIPLILMSRG